MIIFFYISLLVLIGYGFLIDYYRRSWTAMPDFKLNLSANKGLTKKVTVIIPARNEEKNISRCLESLVNQSYPKEFIEIIVVNDHSTDQTAWMVSNFQASNIRLINLADEPSFTVLNSYKKKALEIAINAASGEWIMTTDADCACPPDWISTMISQQVQENAALIAAPVRILDNHSLLSVFQTLDFISLQGITGAAVYKHIHAMCNGANLGYAKKAFQLVDGFKGIDHIASGDDMLLMHKISQKFPKQIFFLKSTAAIVDTRPVENWKDFINQRIRWASKSTHYQDQSITQSLVLVFILNLIMLCMLISGFWNIKFLLFFLIMVVIKTIFEFPFVYSVAGFFGQRRLMKYFFFLQPLHIFYTVIAGSLGKWGSYKWKGRKIK